MQHKEIEIRTMNHNTILRHIILEFDVSAHQARTSIIKEHMHHTTQYI